MGDSIDSSLTNVRNSNKGLNEVIEANKHIFLLKFSIRRKKEEDKKLEEARNWKKPNEKSFEMDQKRFTTNNTLFIYPTIF
jgi:hypothetical protein